MQSGNPRVGVIKLEEIVDRSIVRKLDDSGCNRTRRARKEENRGKSDFGR